MAKILRFPAPPEPPTPRPSRGLEFTIRLDAEKLAKALTQRILNDSDRAAKDDD